MSDKNVKKARSRTLLIVAAVMLAAFATGAFIFQSNLKAIVDLHAMSGWEGVYYRAKDSWPWASPNVSWESVDPTTQDLDAGKIEELQDKILAANTTAFLVVHKDRIIAEIYGPKYGPNKRIGTSAMGKTITAAMLVLLAIDDGLIMIDDPMYAFLPTWRGDPDKKAITIRHIVTHSSGLDDVHFGSTELTGWKKFYYDNPRERFLLAMNVAPVRFEPGSQFEYSGLGFYALAYALATQFHDKTGSDLKEILRARIMDPLGVPQHDWSISYGESYQIDGMTMYAIGSGGAYTPRAIARIGQMLVNKGVWNGRQLLDTDSVEQMMACGGPRSEYRSNRNHPAPGGIGVWSNCDGYWPSLPRDSILGLGGSHNFLLVVPSLDLVAVRLGGLLPRLDEEQPHWQVLESAVFSGLLQAIGSQHRSATNDLRDEL